MKYWRTEISVFFCTLTSYHIQKALPHLKIKQPLLSNYFRLDENIQAKNKEGMCDSTKRIRTLTYQNIEAELMARFWSENRKTLPGLMQYHLITFHKHGQPESVNLTWLKEWNSKLMEENKDFLLLLESFKGHEFPETISKHSMHFQPLDAGTMNFFNLLNNWERMKRNQQETWWESFSDSKISKCLGSTKIIKNPSKNCQESMGGLFPIYIHFSFEFLSLVEIAFEITSSTFLCMNFRYETIMNKNLFYFVIKFSSMI
ncbi:hypothetical protein VP01_694g9 [Puccinia sorghi]|uniref:Uncharacterized protein n=1 Tax=Puccinia sorghi TaxID=27349 RepID=A0A0L6UE00_9BASI|nr:hypothetical protein VP01_694g9 [Puccinia sorghi]